MFLILYIFTIVLSYFIQRKLFQLDEDADCYPMLLMILTLFIPIINIIASTIFLIAIIDYKKFFRL